MLGVVINYKSMTTRALYQFTIIAPVAVSATLASEVMGSRLQE